MTAEICLLNKNGLVFAADSAVTVANNQDSKVFNSANKLFSLGDNHDIGIMIYGNADFMGMPWEVIIKEFKQTLGNEKYKTVEDYTSLFFDFVKGIKQVKNKVSLSMVIDNYVFEIFEFIYNRFQSELSEAMNSFENQNSQDYDEFTNDVFIDVIEEIYQSSKNIDPFKKRIPEGKFEKKYGEIIKSSYQSLCENNLGGISYKKTASKFSLIVQNFLYNKDFYSNNHTGIVIGGYGLKDLLPKVFSYTVEGYIDQSLKYKQEKKSVTIEIDNIQSSVIPFAQQEMVHTIMKGIDPELQFDLEQLIEKSFLFLRELLEERDVIDATDENCKDVYNSVSESVVDALRDSIKDLSEKKFSNPITSMLSIMPKEELPVMAETLVNITSFKRKFSMSLETVGGPIDVLLITKSDGPIWIKRKHYFNPSLNQDFFNRKNNHI